MEQIATYTSFGRDVYEGLTSNPKHLSAKYFYDDAGSRIFRQIMEMPEYYVTRCELEILMEQSEDILAAVNLKSEFNIVEFGSGDGFKTRHLLKALADKKADFTYIPIDISAEAIEQLKTGLHKSFPSLDLKPIVGDYFDSLETLTGKSNRKNLFLSLGSNIGNYKFDEMQRLITKFYNGMNFGDKILIGFDLKKNPEVIKLAYDDPHGTTKAFNINLLCRMNRELETDFNVGKFDFQCFYNPENGEVNSYLVSLEHQNVYSRVLESQFYFEKKEMIWTEVSRKFSVAQICDLAESAGFKVAANFTDSKNYFTDSLWEK